MKIVALMVFISLHLGVDGRLPEILFFFYISALLLVGITFWPENKIQIRLSTAHIIMVSLMVGVVFRYLWQGNPYGSYSIYLALMFFLLFFAFSAQLWHYKQFSHYLAWLAIFTATVEVLWGIGQSLGFVGNKMQLLLKSYNKNTLNSVNNLPMVK